MRILHIPHSYYPNIGGLEYHCARLSEVLVQMGHTVCIAVPDTPAPNAYFDLHYLPVQERGTQINGVSIVSIPFVGTRTYQLGRHVTRWSRHIPSDTVRWSFVRGFLRRAAVRHAIPALERLIEQFRPDVVVTMAHMLPNMHWMLELNQRYHLPLLQMPMFHYNATETIVAAVPQLQQGDAVLAISSTEAEALKKTEGLNPEMVFRGGTGTDIPLTLTSKGETLYVLMLGRKVPHKGIDIGIAAMREVWRTLPHVQLVLVGARDATSGFIDVLLATLSTRERQNVLEYDSISDTRKSTLLRNALCLLFPSTSESFGLVLIESMAHGTPPVTWDIPLFKEIVTHGETGLLCELGSAGALAEQILSLAQNSTYAAQLGACGHEYVKMTYQWSRIAQNYIEAYYYARGHAAGQPLVVEHNAVSPGIIP